MNEQDKLREKIPEVKRTIFVGGFVGAFGAVSSVAIGVAGFRWRNRVLERYIINDSGFVPFDFLETAWWLATAGAFAGVGGLSGMVFGVHAYTSFHDMKRVYEIEHWVESKSELNPYECIRVSGELSTMKKSQRDFQRLFKR
jgi:hypothetical protein